MLSMSHQLQRPEKGILSIGHKEVKFGGLNKRQLVLLLCGKPDAEYVIGNNVGKIV